MTFAKSAAALGAALSLLIVGNGASAQPVESVLPAAWLEAQVNERGQKCDRRAEKTDQASVLVACGAAGAWEIALSEDGPRLVRSHDFSGDVIGFFREPDGRLWVKLQVLEARPFAQVAGSARFPEASVTPLVPGPALVQSPQDQQPKPGAVAAAGEQAKATATVGEVLRSSPGEVVISLGSTDGVMRSDRIELSSEREDGGERAALSRETLAVGVVSHVSPHSAKVRLGLNERVPVGALASISRSPSSASLIAPPRVAGVWAADFMLRPFAAIGELGGGVLLGASISRRFSGNWVLRAGLEPLAWGDVEGRDALTAASGALIASYDSQYFEMGVGLGGQTVNEADIFTEPGSGYSAAQLVRLGARDGLSFSARTSFVLFHSELAFGDMVAHLQIPVSRGYWLLFGGGGGTVGYGYGEFGLRALLSGNGHAGTKLLTVTAGGAAVFRSALCQNDFTGVCREALSYGGPMAGIGTEWRF